MSVLDLVTSVACVTAFTGLAVHTTSHMLTLRNALDPISGNAKVLMFTFLGMLAFGMCFAILRIIFYALPESSTHFPSTLCELYWKSYIVWQIAKVLMYIFYIFRVQKTFKHSHWEMSKKTCFSLIAFIIAFYTATCIIFSVVQSERWHDRDNFPSALKDIPDAPRSFRDCQAIEDYNWR